MSSVPLGEPVRVQGGASGALPEWRFFLLALPLGVVANGFGAILLPVLLRQNGVAVGDIAAIEGLFLVPLTLQFLWTIVFDARIDTGRALRSTSLLAAALCGAALSLPVQGHLGRFVGLAFAGQVCAALSFACCGSMMAKTLPSSQWGRASGYAMAGVLGGGALGGTVLTYLASARGSASAAVAVSCLTGLPALTARSFPPAVKAGVGLASSLRETWRVLRSSGGKRLLLLAILPGGAAGLLTLLSSLAPDYGVGATTVAMTNGLLGAGCMAAGSLVGGIACDRVAPHRAWLWALAALLLGGAGLVASRLPLVPSSYVGAVLGYDFLAGLSYAIFPAVVLDVVGASPMALSLYALYYGVGVLATTYSAIIDGQFHDRQGPAGLLRADGALNVFGAVCLGIVLVAFRRRGKPSAAIAVET